MKNFFAEAVAEHYQLSEDGDYPESQVSEQDLIWADFAAKEQGDVKHAHQKGYVFDAISHYDPEYYGRLIEAILTRDPKLVGQVIMGRMLEEAQTLCRESQSDIHEIMCARHPLTPQQTIAESAMYRGDE